MFLKQRPRWIGTVGALTVHHVVASTTNAGCWVGFFVLFVCFSKLVKNNKIFWGGNRSIVKQWSTECKWFCLSVWISFYQFTVPVQTSLESRVCLFFFTVSYTINTVLYPSESTSGSTKFCWFPVFTTFDFPLCIHHLLHIWLVPFNSPAEEEQVPQSPDSWNGYVGFSKIVPSCVNAKFRLKKINK